MLLYYNPINNNILISILSFLIQKSAQNYDIAKFLEAGLKYCSSIIHSSYYSSFQIILHIIYNIDNKSKYEIRGEARIQQVSYHEHCIKYIFNDLKEKMKDGKIDSRQITMFYNDINKLRKLRNDADYEDSDVTVTNMNKSILLSLNINGILKTTYNI